LAHNDAFAVLRDRALKLQRFNKAAFFAGVGKVDDAGFDAWSRGGACGCEYLGDTSKPGDV
jgi:hypothetical protein